MSTPVAGNNAEQQEVLFIACGGMQRGKTTLEESLAIFNKAKHRALPYFLAILCPRYFLNPLENLCPHKNMPAMFITASFVIAKKLEATTISFNIGLEKQTVVYHMNLNAYC